jgi:hypothetical protein
MTDYVKSTNFASKDALASGNPLKIVKGLEIDIEFNNIAAAIATKSNGVDTALTGTPTAPTAASGTNTSQIATTAFVRTAIMDSVYPVGSVYISAGSATNPATLLGFGTWTAFGAGRVMVGLNGSDTLFDTLEETGGSKDAIAVAHTHTGTTDSAGNHQHFVAQNQQRSGYPGTPTTTSSVADKYFGGGPTNEAYAMAPGTGTADVGLSSTAGAHTHPFTTGSTGSSGTNANLQPYITVAMWKRTA